MKIQTSGCVWRKMLSWKNSSEPSRNLFQINKCQDECKFTCRIMRHMQVFLNQRDWVGIHNVLMKCNQQRTLTAFGSLQGFKVSVYIKTHQLVHQRRTPSAVRFIEWSGLSDEGAEVGFVVLLWRGLVPVALCRKEIWEPEHFVLHVNLLKRGWKGRKTFEGIPARIFWLALALKSSQLALAPCPQPVLWTE